MTDISSYPARRCFYAALIVLFYTLTRGPSLGRDVAFEEPSFLLPGVSLLAGQGFSYDWGILHPHESAFTKPPLTSLLLGLFAHVGHDPVAGARLVPFLVGLFVCLLPLVITGSWIPSALVLASPFLFGASAHMQTDPIVGLLGFGLISSAIVTFSAEQDTAAFGFIFSGLLILWLGKLETAVIASACLGLVAVFSERRWTLIRWVLISSVVGASSFVLLTWILGRTAGLPFNASVMDVIQTLTRISTTLSATRNRSVVWRDLEYFKAPELFLLCLIPSVVIILLRARVLATRNTPHLYLLTTAIVPAAVYLYGGRAGDGFPRYFLIAFPSLLILLGLCLREIEDRPAWSLATKAVLLLGACALLLPTMLRMWKDDGSINTTPGVKGGRTAALYTLAVTKPGDLVVTPDSVGYYMIGQRRRLLTVGVNFFL